MTQKYGFFDSQFVHQPHGPICGELVSVWIWSFPYIQQGLLGETEDRPVKGYHGGELRSLITGSKENEYAPKPCIKMTTGSPEP